MLNLDRGGKSDPFLRLGKLTGNTNWRDAKNEALGREVGRTVRASAAAAAAVVAELGGRHCSGSTAPTTTMPNMKISAVAVAAAAVVQVYKTEVVMNNLSPQWHAFKVEAGRLCNCDRNRKIFLSVYDWDKDGTHDLIGQARASFAELEQLANGGGGGSDACGVKLTHPKMGSTAVGTLMVAEARMSDEVERELLCLRAQVCLDAAATAPPLLILIAGRPACTQASRRLHFHPGNPPTS